VGGGREPVVEKLGALEFPPPAVFRLKTLPTSAVSCVSGPGEINRAQSDEESAHAAGEVAKIKQEVLLITNLDNNRVIPPNMQLICHAGSNE